ncbi:RHS repeat domain-containing protein, partial [Escherichia coli]|uniref:RHS repeat domain-containing protein n=1 Tax=Escherichia coli TaxID=562 RepID=UPI001C6FFB1A
PDGNRSETQYDAWGKAVSTTQGGLTRSMEYDAAGRVISLTNENGSHSDFSYDALDRLVQQGGFDGRTQRYHYDLTGKLTQSEDEGLITLWHYDASDRITHRTVNGDPAEQWQYDEHGWLTTLSHTSEGHRVSVHYGYDDKGRLTGERQTVENPETGELLWHHETGHAYNEQGLANRVTPDSLPPVEWLTYGSGYLAGMKLGGTPLLEFTRDRLHRETVRSFGSMAGSNAAYKLTSTYTPAGQLQSQHLNSLVYDRDYGWNDNGDLVRISGPRQTREYGYSATGRLESVRTLAPDLDIREIRADRVSSESRAWLAQCGLTVEQLARQVEPEYTPARKAHLYHCDHRGLPLALISEDGNTAWSAEYDEWGNQLNEENPHHVYQPYRLPGQQHDEESGLYYNRHRYYDPLQGRYITQDPMGLKGGWNLYQYPLNPLQQIDPMGLLQTWDDARSGACTGGVCGVLSRIIGPSKFDSTADAALDALKETQNRSLCNDMEYSGIVCKDTNGKYFASKAETDNLRKESYPLKRKCPTGTDRVAAYHTHGADSHGDYVDEFFSSSDKNLVRSKDNNLEAFYLATPDGRFEALNNKGEYIFIRNSVPGLSSVCIPYHD